MPSAPLFFTRLSIYGMALVWGIISLSFGLDATVKQNKLKSHVRHAVGDTAAIRLVDNNIVQPLIAVEVFCVLTFIAGILAVIGLFIRSWSNKIMLRVQGYVWAFLTVALFATQIPYSNVLRKDTIFVQAWFPNGTEFTQAQLEATASALGVNLYYKHHDFLLWYAVMPWIAFLFTLLSTIVSFEAKPIEEHSHVRDEEKKAPIHE
ncbi:hypothetical protein FISHEDRAFT_77068 [Fistulina hepatica ATCC 64428]|uniref:Uncharacterized protein n=1 Tax=Fistulina hepatica ATCC 64428 TaxID=1128425 RepID=A0A0D7A226_9AGAR|nr:hypothetical protein FISHEDRAFT_77068 [Fistulina hepatica ATCC 64428]